MCQICNTEYSSLLADRLKALAVKCVYQLSHRITEYPVLEGTHQDHQSPILGPAQDIPRIPPCAQDYCPNTSGTLSGLMLSSLPWGTCSSAQSPPGGNPFPEIQPKPWIN